jgi:hypothetical protein
MRIEASRRAHARGANALCALLFLVTCPFAGMLHVEMQGVVTSINFDTLGSAYSDSVGLKVGSQVAFSVDLDYSAPPIMSFDGMADTLPNLVYPDQSDSSVTTRNFRYGFAGTRFAQGLFATPSSVLGDHGLIEYSPSLPTLLELSSNRQWNDSVSWVDLVFPAPDGKLTDSSQGKGQEELLIAQTTGRNASTLLVCAYDITRVTVSPSVSLARPDPTRDSRRRTLSDTRPGWGALRSKKGWFSINGRRE